MAAIAGTLKAKALAKEAQRAAQGLAGGMKADSLAGLGNTRIQATLGSQKSQSNSAIYTETNQASNIATNNLALIATGAGENSNINVNGSNLNVTNDALFKADNDFNLNGVAQNSNTRSTNSSSNTAIGGYMDSSGSGGITASASRAKGSANSDSVTYANTQVNIGGTTTFDIGNDVNGKGVVFNTDKVQGIIRGNVNMESPQDTYTYDSNQKSAGFNLDVDLLNNGAGSSLSVNGAKTNITANSKMVAQQTGLFANEADVIVEGTGNFKGAVFLTSEEAQANGKSNIVFKQGVTSTDVINTTSYEGDAFSAGLSIGKTNNKPQAAMNGLGYGTDGDSDSSITKGGVSGYNDPQGILTTDNREALAGSLKSVFDETRVNEELGAQVEITKEFGKEAPKAVGDFANNRIKAIIADTTLSNTEKQAAIAKWDEGGIYRVAAHTALGALGTGSLEGALTTGGIAAAAPTLNSLQDKMAESLIASGMSEDIAKGTASGVVSLALLGAGSAAGLDTSSTVTATNVDANNRQLHPSQITLLKLNAGDYAKEKGISEEEALKILARAAVYYTDEGWYNAYNTHLSLDEIKQFDDAINFLRDRTPSTTWNMILAEESTSDGRPLPFDNVSVDALRGPFEVRENPESYTDSRMYLKEMLSDADSVQFALENLALQDPRTYGRTPETAAEVQNAKAEGTNQGFANVATAPIGFIQGIKQGITNLFTNPEETVKGAYNSTVEMVKSIPEIPEELSYKGYEDDLAIMQGKGLEVNRNNAQGSTELGIDIGLAGYGTATTLAAQAAKPKILFMDSFTESGATVRHGTNSTAIGDDGNTIRNYENATDTGNGHNVIVHGYMNDEDGLGNQYRPDVPYANDIPISNAQIAQSVRSNPNYVEGTPIYYASCWSGTTGSAQNLANELGVPVYAPTRPVAWDKKTNSWFQQSNEPNIRFNPNYPEIEPKWEMFYPNK